MRGLHRICLWEARVYDITILCELFWRFTLHFSGGELPAAGDKSAESSTDFIRDYRDNDELGRVREMIDPSLKDFAAEIIWQKFRSNGSEVSHLFGEYISQNEKRTAEFLNTLPQQEID